MRGQLADSRSDLAIVSLGENSAIAADDAVFRRVKDAATSDVFLYGVINARNADVPEVTTLARRPDYAESITRLNLEKGRDMLQRITTSEQTSHRNSPASRILLLEKLHS